MNIVWSINAWIYAILHLSCMKKQLTRLRKLWKCSSLNISIMQLSHAWSYLATLPGDIHIHPLKTHLSLIFKGQCWNGKRNLRNIFPIMVTALSPWKDLSSFPLLKAFHYFTPASGIGRTSLSKYLISNVTVVSWLVFICHWEQNICGPHERFYFSEYGK